MIASSLSRWTIACVLGRASTPHFGKRFRELIEISFATMQRSVIFCVVPQPAVHSTRERAGSCLVTSVVFLHFQAVILYILY